MNISIGSRWEAFAEEAVSSGRYGNISEVIREGLRLVEERETRFQSLRASLYTITQVSDHDEYDVAAAIDAAV